jgi:hypothetical protein
MKITRPRGVNCADSGTPTIGVSHRTFPSVPNACIASLSARKARPSSSSSAADATANRSTSSEHQIVSPVAASSTYRWQPGAAVVTYTRPSASMVGPRLTPPPRLRCQASVTSSAPSTGA